VPPQAARRDPPRTRRPTGHSEQKDTSRPSRSTHSSRLTLTIARAWIVKTPHNRRQDAHRILRTGPAWVIDHTSGVRRGRRRAAYNRKGPTIASGQCPLAWSHPSPASHCRASESARGRGGTKGCGPRWVWLQTPQASGPKPLGAGNNMVWRGLVGFEVGQFEHVATRTESLALLHDPTRPPMMTACRHTPTS